MTDDARVGLVGLTARQDQLLRMIAEVIAPDSGRIARPQRSGGRLLPQDSPQMGGRKTLDETLSGTRARCSTRRAGRAQPVLAEHHSGPGHDAALAELGDVLSDSNATASTRPTAAPRRCCSGWASAGTTLRATSPSFPAASGCVSRWPSFLVRRPEFLMLDEPTKPARPRGAQLARGLAVELSPAESSWFPTIAISSTG